ncbi:vacuolar cation/proton exchanger 3 isoform X1 [Capsicum annuum]|uniref:vacuolar cation/proton exchanger 3 isoform X1 n=1 Tax=Capsicum annuum TaxID=4072 RepID=UPI001FB0718F|nr:vacuolar cation/proton exchanger 3 isoform X1 [Capsicum annuum]XP_047271452.1 vacuolar cation/proton exchanger 3 isoform X1 [Capsicum annuum]
MAKNLKNSGGKSHLEMGSLEGRAVLQLEDENLMDSKQNDKKASSMDATPQISVFDSDTDDVSCRCMWNSLLRQMHIVLFSQKLNLLIPCGLVAMVIDTLSDHNSWIFFLSLLGIIPLAERLGWATEQLAFYTGPTVGGLLNATFGNATELIISIYALRMGMIRVVQQSLLGSILSNTLLVLGCAFFGGGIVHPSKDQLFDKGTAVMNSGLLLMSVMGLLFPAVLHVTHTELEFGKSELALSRFSSCVMLVAYGAYLYYQLTTQNNNLYMPIAEEAGENDESLEEEEAPEISKWGSVIWLSILTIWIAVLSQHLVNAIEGASDALRIPVAFISVILLPIVGNAAEHAGAVMFAIKDKLDISLGVAIGSSTQIAMFGIPFCVVIGWILGRPMDLNFQMFETATLFMSVLVVAFMVQDGTSNYFKGLMLLLCYLIVAASFFVHIDPDDIHNYIKSKQQLYGAILWCGRRWLSDPRFRVWG